MDYKKIIKSQNIRFGILKCLQWIPDSVMLHLQYRIKMGRWGNFKHPERLSEKLQSYKLYYHNPIMHICVDKQDVRTYVKEKGLKHILVDSYGVWDNAALIDFNSLPNSFVLKTTNGGGGLNVLLVPDKKKLDIEATVNSLNKKLIRGVNAAREWAYYNTSKPRIIAEQLLINPEKPECGVEDFKIFCFNGSPQFIIVDKDRFIGHKRNFYTTDWRRIDVDYEYPQDTSSLLQPENLDEMLEVARILSTDFPFVRVDLYNVSGKIYFGELTFYPSAGYMKFTPDAFDLQFGDMLDCSTFMK